MPGEKLAELDTAPVADGEVVAEDTHASADIAPTLLVLVPVGHGAGVVPAEQ